MISVGPCTNSGGLLLVDGQQAGIQVATPHEAGAERVRKAAALRAVGGPDARVGAAGVGARGLAGAAQLRHGRLHIVHGVLAVARHKRDACW